MAGSARAGACWIPVGPPRRRSPEKAGVDRTSVGDPGLGQEPWGMVNTTTNGPGDSAWWQDHGVRRTQELTLHLHRGLIRSLSK